MTRRAARCDHESMRAIQIQRTGGPEVLELVDVELPPPGPGEATVRHTAIGVNLIDTYHRSGLYSLPGLPHGLGTEAAGIVEAVGEGVEIPLGRRVVYFQGPPRSYAEARNVPADRLVRIPDAVGDAVAAAALLKGMTVEYLIRRTFAVQPGMTVLFHAAAGGVGTIACQWLSHLGATVIGTVSTEAKAEHARKNGCAHPILYTEEDFVERVRAITDGAGVPVVYDSVGKDTFDGSLDCLAPRGMLVAFGNASGKPGPFDPMRLVEKGSLFLTRASLFHYVATQEELAASAKALFDVIASGAVKIHIGQEFALEDARTCHEALESRQTVGSTLLVP